MITYAILIILFSFFYTFVQVNPEKTAEYLQKNGEVSIVYELIKFEGPPHRRKFYTKLIIDSKELTYGEGYSKKESEQNAAKAALEILEGENE